MGLGATEDVVEKKESVNEVLVQPDWYKINGEWYHCHMVDGKAFVNGVMQKEVKPN